MYKLNLPTRYLTFKEQKNAVVAQILTIYEDEFQSGQIPIIFISLYSSSSLPSNWYFTCFNLDLSRCYSSLNGVLFHLDRLALSIFFFFLESGFNVGREKMLFIHPLLILNMRQLTKGNNESKIFGRTVVRSCSRSVVSRQRRTQITISFSLISQFVQSRLSLLS